MIKGKQKKIFARKKMHKKYSHKSQRNKTLHVGILMKMKHSIIKCDPKN